MPSSKLIRTYLLRVSVFLGLIGGVAANLYPALRASFENNLFLNSMIAATFLLGVGLVYKALMSLHREYIWIKLVHQSDKYAPKQKPRFLTALAVIFERKMGEVAPTLTQQEAESALKALDSRLHEAREGGRYIIGLLVFLGLLGTFWGLSQTIKAVAGVIANLSSQGDSLVTFDTLKAGLREPLGGMGTAFSCSMFGLAGSLLLGFLELQISRAYGRFYHEVEEWLMAMVRPAQFSFHTLPENTADPHYLLKVMEYMAEGVDGLQRTIGRSEEGQRLIEHAIIQLQEKFGVLSEHVKATYAVMGKLSEGNLLVQKMLHQMGGEWKLDEESRSHLRQIGITLTRLTDETHDNHRKLIEELRREVRLLARAPAEVTRSGGKAEVQGDTPRSLQQQRKDFKGESLRTELKAHTIKAV